MQNENTPNTKVSKSHIQSNLSIWSNSSRLSKQNAKHCLRECYRVAKMPQDWNFNKRPAFYSGMQEIDRLNKRTHCPRAFNKLLLEVKLTVQQTYVYWIMHFSKDNMFKGFSKIQIKCKFYVDFSLYLTLQTPSPTPRWNLLSVEE